METFPEDEKAEVAIGCSTAEEIIHLPVAPQITAMTRFSSALPNRISFMMPVEAVDFLSRVYEQKGGKIDMVAISGPGDPLAVPDTTLQTIALVRQRFPGMKIGLQTLGIGAEKFAKELAAAGVGYVEMVVNAVKAELLEKIYAWIRPGQKTLKINHAVKLLMEEQKNGVPALKYHRVFVAISTMLYPEINGRHIGQISRKMMELGADSIAVTPCESEPGSQVIPKLAGEREIIKAVKAAARYLPVVEAKLTSRCRCQPVTPTSITHLIRPRPTVEKPNVAVISSNGVEIDTHLGKADKILIYGPREDGLPCLLDARQAPPPGGGAARWIDLAAAIDDCFVLLAAQAGEMPRQILSENDIPVLITDDQIAGVVEVLYGIAEKGRKREASI